MSPVISVISFIYPILCVVVPCVAYQLVLYKTGNRHEKISKGNLVWRFVFILYLYLVMSVVGMGSIWEIGKYGEVIRWDEINLVPFQSEGILLYLLNVVMMVPLGFLLPLIWEKYRSIPRTIFAGFMFSLSIELGQLFNRRKTDIDDILMNVLGVIVGYCLWLIIDKLFKTKPKGIPSLNDKPLVYLILTVLGTFLLYNWRWFLRFV